MKQPIAFMRLLIVLIFASFLGACGAMDTVGGWFSSDDEDPREPVELEKITESVKIKKLWSTGVGNGQGKGLYKIRAAVEGDVIYAASANGEVVALNRQSGKKLWDVKFDQGVSGGVGVYENSLFLGTSEGLVLKIDATTGEVQWSTPLRGEVLAPPQGNGRVVVAQTYDGKLQGLDFATGEQLWVHDSNVPVLTVRGTSAPILFNRRVYAGFANGRVLAFDASSGAVLWEARVAISQGRSEIERIVDIDGSMELVGNELYAASYQGRVVAIDITNGRKIWQQDTSSYSGVAQGFGNIYVTDEDGTVSAYLRNGQGARWRQEALGFRDLSRPTTVSSYVAVADFEGVVHFISQVDGEFVGRVKADGSGVRADMLSDGNVLYVYGNSGKLVAYEITSRDD